MLYFQAATNTLPDKQFNVQQFDVLGEWVLTVRVPFSPRIVQALELDDYANLVYSKNDNNITLYVGYYNSLKKVGAAHSPLVCVPGQGWAITSTESVEIAIGNQHINAHVIEAEMNEQKKLIVYWYQAYDKTFSGTLLQKMYTFFAKSVHGRESNAFVQITTNINDGTVSEKLLLTKDFLSYFYPQFLNFMTS